jgi:murein DD-endopeptidase MepM/ murein hydrolase activator NlpD
MDLTRDPSDHLLVLDQLSNGKGRIKAFTGDSSGGTSLGGVDLPDTVSATPIRMDANDWVDPTYGNLIFVLHGDGIAGYYMSIFFPSELPW